MGRDGNALLERTAGNTMLWGALLSHCCGVRWRRTAVGRCCHSAVNTVAVGRCCHSAVNTVAVGRAGNALLWGAAVTRAGDVLLWKRAGNALLVRRCCDTRWKSAAVGNAGNVLLVACWRRTSSSSSPSPCCSDSLRFLLGGGVPLSADCLWPPFWLDPACAPVCKSTTQYSARLYK